MNGERIGRDYFYKPTLDVARGLLGAKLVHIVGGRRIAGIIKETEAYCGIDDQGCHARSGPTPRNQIMFGDAGYAYVYFTYGMHWLFNVITQVEGVPEAVLIRAIQPDEGIDFIEARRGTQPRKIWTNGPAKLTMALAVDGSHNGLDLTKPKSELFLEYGKEVADEIVLTGPRIGLNTTPEPWKTIPWRFWVEGMV
ncbi:MAG: DNA-3-methyladenine glycosylase [Anaerolineales bacterium]|nr:DNA-3-methyladenine glycosylase [Anaerolineales bacterium]